MAETYCDAAPGHQWHGPYHDQEYGGEIVNEFLMSIGYLPGAHVPGCPVYRVILQRQPPWSVT